MRRGLMKWLPEELPASVIEERVARLQQAMCDAGFDALLVHTSFAQPAAVHWLTNFTPYWSEALLVVLPEGQPVLLAALTPRVHAWIREVSHLGELVSAPKLGPAAAKWLEPKLPASPRLGVVGLDTLSWSVAEPVLAAFGAEHVHDASELFRQVRQPADTAERALAAKAASIAEHALQAIPAGAELASTLASAADGSARLAGAEEVLLRLAPDLEQSSALLRLEGELPLATRHALELSLAYKGVWIRVARSFSRGEKPRAWAEAAAWFDKLLSKRETLGALLAGQLSPPAGLHLHWTLEASCGLQPLSVIAASEDLGLPGPPTLAPGTLCVLSVTLQGEGGHWRRSSPLVIHEQTVERLDSPAP